jgi:hypothetical protein
MAPWAFIRKRLMLSFVEPVDEHTGFRHGHLGVLVRHQSFERSLDVQPRKAGGHDEVPERTPTPERQERPLDLGLPRG